MPKLDDLLYLATAPIDPAPPSWPRVFYLLVEHDTPGLGDLGAAVAASAQASIFSYARRSMAPMYFCTIGGYERLRSLTGYRVEGLRTVDPEEAFEFVRGGIDDGAGVFISGPEIGLCYGYGGAEKAEGREVYGYSDWGPAFDGAYSWSRFCRHVQEHGNAEGLARVRRDSSPAPPSEIVRTIASTVVDWQDHHPATGFGMRQEFYGTTAFRTFIDDVRDPETRCQVDDAYINCHAIMLQVGGRYWFARYLGRLADRLTGEHRTRLLAIGDLYRTVHGELARFMNFDVNRRTEDEAQVAVGWLDTACGADARIVEEFGELRDRL
jgi:hypothetical protein